MSVSINEVYGLWPMLVRYANSFIHNTGAAEDIAQNAIVSHYNNKNAKKDIQDVRACLLYHIRLKCHTYHKSAKVAATYKKEISALSVHEEPDYFARIEKEVLLQRIRELIPRMHPRQREVFTLKFIKGMSNKKIAEKLSITESTARVQYQRAIMFFRENIKGHR